ncbi:hypothetical protein BZB76_0928 [Actinomadura pelletieri DSM 43383]|uniref:PknH-like protein n=1 Tax=Actinomadura pelletieri DSM 43383 TaxID=1120940 RepID=A0A495QZ97_9ACTN|nr:hypothetical protein [Actinomadura pelletieri]RKS79462.1 hypothetical protein BZB76_0928 [Actinomadura pelletieri DSM 43383]
MAHRLFGIMLLSTAAAITACGGDAERARPVHGTAPADVAGVGYTSAQLAQALLTHLPGYRRVGEPDSGEYGTLTAIQNAARLQRETETDKRACGTSRPAATVPGDAPAALTTFTSKGLTVTETLMGMSAADAEKQVNARVPADCLRFRTRVGTGRWAEHRIVEAPKGDIGEGSRTVGVSTVTGTESGTAGGTARGTTAGGAVRTRTWYVVVRGRHYLATITVHGPSATRADAEDLARAAVEQAGRIL